MMLRTLFFSADKSIYRVELRDGNHEFLRFDIGYEIRSLAVDPNQPGRVYAGSFDDGLLISDDAGVTWYVAGDGISYRRSLSIAVSRSEIIDGYGVVWVGTEPSGLFRSEDGGRTWRDHPNLLELPSASTWSFPPRPHTHHVRSIVPDIHRAGRIFVGIE